MLHRLALTARSSAGLAVAALCAAACSGASSSATDASSLLDLAAGLGDLSATPPDQLALADLAGPPDLQDVYPPGPYGTGEGEVVRNFTWKGYLDDQGIWPATNLPYGDVSLQDLRRTGGRYLMIATGAFW